MIKITFPDNSVKEYAAGTTAMQIAESISPRLAKEVLAAGVNGEIWDLTRPINEDASLKLYKWEDEEGKHVKYLIINRHSKSKNTSFYDFARTIHSFICKNSYGCYFSMSDFLLNKAESAEQYYP